MDIFHVPAYLLVPCPAVASHIYRYVDMSGMVL